MDEDSIFLIDDLGMNGEGVAHDGGYTCFIENALVGERVRARVTYAKGNSVFAVAEDIIERSPDRVQPLCPLFSKCGGCDVQHMSARVQAQFKKSRVEVCFKKNRLVTEVNDTVSGEKKYAYRNKLQLPFGFSKGRAVLGFFKKNSHSVVPISDCPLHGEWASKLISAVELWANEKRLSVYNERTGKGLLRHLVARYLCDALSVTVVVNGDSLPFAGDLAKSLERAFDNFALYVSPNKKNTNVILGDKVRRLYGAEQSVELNGLQVKLHPFSFFQVNDEMREKMYSAVLANLGQADVIIDAYSGAGLLTAMVARRYPDAQIYGLEIVREACEDADLLMKNNRITNVKNVCGDCAIELPILINNLFTQSNQSDKTVIRANATTSNPTIAVILDPPRKGCEPAVLDAILRARPSQIIYISCNPATLSRDLAYISKDYQIRSATPYDLFPQTSHIETLVLLRTKSKVEKEGNPGSSNLK